MMFGRVLPVQAAVGPERVIAAQSLGNKGVNSGGPEAQLAAQREEVPAVLEASNLKEIQEFKEFRVPLGVALASYGRLANNEADAPQAAKITLRA